MEGLGEKPHLRNVFLGVLIGTLVLSSVALVDFIERGGNWQDRTIRAIVPGSDYNWLSTYMVLASPIVLYCAIRFRFLWGKIFSCCTLALALLAHAASYTRAGWLAFVAQLFTWGFVTGRRLVLAGFILLIIFAAVSLVGIAQMGYQTDTLHTWTAETRLQVWKLGVEQMISHPFVGIGYGNNIFQPVLADSPMGDQPMHLHNTPLMVGVGSGIPALVFFMWVFIRLGAELFPGKKQKTWTDSETLTLCFGIVLVGFLCRNLFDYMFAGSLAYLFWILMACGLESNERRH
jgi:heptosyltransferase-3/putative inorganic carbon (HCO3(-)) transporter